MASERALAGRVQLVAAVAGQVEAAFDPSRVLKPSVDGTKARWRPTRHEGGAVLPSEAFHYLPVTAPFTRTLRRVEDSVCAQPHGHFEQPIEGRASPPPLVGCTRPEWVADLCLPVDAHNDRHVAAGLPATICA